jgi:peroxiredoxin
MKKLLLIIVLFCINIPVLFSQTIGLGIGNIAPDIGLPNPKGETVALSSFKGKVVLIDFWASWCPPCVKEQSELVVLYNRYKDSDFTAGKGFEIYGVSLDNKKAAWESIIKKAKINWTQVSDLKFWTSPVTKTYNIQALPFNVLIDGKGIIIAKDLHDNDLEYFITNLISGGETKSKIQ